MRSSPVCATPWLAVLAAVLVLIASPASSQDGPPARPWFDSGAAAAGWRPLRDGEGGGREAEAGGLWRLPDQSAVAPGRMVLDGLGLDVEPWDGDGYPAPDTVRVLAYNIHHGEGMDEAVDLERIAALIRSVDPDLVTLQEVDSATTRTGGEDQAAALGRLTGLAHVFGAFMPYQGGAYGMAILSRWPVEDARNLRLPDGAEPRTALAVTVTSPEGRRLRLVGIHFYRTDDERLAQALRLEEQLAGDTVPTVVAGDFNSTPGSEVMAHLSEGWTVVDKGADRLTFPSYGPEREIDFVLFRPGARWEVIEARLLDEPVASDHRPVLVELILRDRDR